jgi:copper(I)-binding protein
MAVLLTGLLNAALRLGNFDTLITTVYGRILAMKLFLVALMALIGAFNRVVLVPKVQRWTTTHAKGGHAVQQFRLSLRIDTVLVLLVLVAAAFLIQGMPPASMQGMPGMEKGNQSDMENMPGMQQGAMAPMEATVPAHLQVTHAWINAMPGGQDATEAFMEITSRLKTTLVRIDSPDADAVEMEHVTLENGVKRMQPIDTILLPAGKTVRFAPGADQLKLIHLHKRLSKGDQVSLRLFTLNANGSQGEVSLHLPVRP